MLRTELKDALKEAMRNKDSQTTSTVRLIMAALKDRDIQARSQGNSDGISDDDLLEMLGKMVKQRRESIALYEKGDRQDLAEREAGEIQVIERFLPKALSEEESQAAIEAVIGELEASSIKDMGRVMGELKSRYPGQMDFGKASALVKQKLA
ncbi:GatB/YqeY domain-containing protein [Rhodovibrionaceae bacterium A322]